VPSRLKGAAYFVDCVVERSCEFIAAGVGTFGIAGLPESPLANGVIFVYANVPRHEFLDSLKYALRRHDRPEGESLIDAGRIEGPRYVFVGAKMAFTSLAK